MECGTLDDVLNCKVVQYGDEGLKLNHFSSNHIKLS